MTTNSLIRLRKGQTSDVRYYVEVDGRKVGWISKRTPYEWDEDRATWWIAYSCYEGELTGRQINGGERTRRDAVAALLNRCNAGTIEQRHAWLMGELDKAYR